MFRMHSMNSREPTTSSTHAGTTGPSVEEATRSKVVWPLLIVASIWFAFWPVFHNGFVDWDDGKILLQNPHYRGLGWAELKWMFTTVYMCHYQPLGWLSYAVDYSIWGLKPHGYFLTNLIIHTAAALCFYSVTRRLLQKATAWPIGESRFGAGIATLLFAVHPLRVESVAWASERRDVLSGLFFVVSVLCYLRFNDGRGNGRGGRAWLAGSLLAFAASLLSKATGVGLPLVLLLLDWYPLRRWHENSNKGAGWQATLLLLEKVPFAVMAALALVVALYAQNRSETIAALGSLGITARLLSAAYGLCFYVRKTILPVGLSPLVPMPEHFDPLAAPFIASALTVLVAAAGLFVLRRRWPMGIALVVYYVVLLLPVMGLVQIGPQLVADRYSYLACLGFAVLAGVGVVMIRRWVSQQYPSVSLLLHLVGCVVLFVLVALTRLQTRVWHDSVTLFSCVLKHYPDSAVANVGKATALAERGRGAEAVPYFLRAVREKPSLVEAHYGLGLALLSQSQFEQAGASFENALRLRPQDVQAWINLGVSRLQQGDIKSSKAALERAVALEPQHVGALFNLGQVLARQDQVGEAIQYWRRALAEAPTSPMLLETLAWYLATSADDSLRNGPEAVRLAEQACRHTNYQDPNSLDALAAAYAEVGRFDLANETATRAARFATQQGLLDLAREIEDRLEHYRLGRPFHSSPLTDNKSNCNS